MINSFILDKITKNKNLRNFLMSSYNLLDIYMIERKPLSSEWIDFNTNFGAVLNDYYKFNTELLKKKNLNLGYEESRFYWFYIDFIMSKPSNGIFTETPKDTRMDLFPKSAKKIALLGNNLEKMVEENNYSHILQDKEFNFRFQEYFTNSFAFFDFVFSEEKGVFSKFSTNKKLFELQSKFLKHGLKNNENIKDFKEFTQKLVISNIYISTSYIKEGAKYSLDYKSVFDKNPEDVYSEYIAFQEKIKEKYHYQQEKITIEKDEYVHFEIFSYVLFSKIWKITKILKKIPEFIDQRERDIYLFCFISKINTYINHSLDNISKFYDGEITLFKLYEKIHDTDKEFIADYFLKDIFPSNFNNPDHQNSELEYKDYWNAKTESNTIDLKASLSNIIENDVHEKYKFYRLLGKSDAETISDVISAIHHNILKGLDKPKAEHINDTHYIGILRSGAFLAHALNILKMYDSEGKTEETQVYAFMTHPYLTILPRIIYRNPKASEDCKKFIYIDEAIKSGYGLLLMDNYRDKTLTLMGHKKCKNDHMYALSDFIDFSKKVSDNIKYSSLMDVVITKDQDRDIIDFKDKTMSIDKFFDWISFLNDLKIDTEDDLAKLRKEARDVALTNNGARLDITKTISYSHLLFTISKLFAKSLLNKIQENKDEKPLNILFFAGSLEGKLLIDTTVFVFKTLYANKTDKDLIFYLDGKTYSGVENTKDDCLRVFCDISIDTGSTKDWVNAIDNKGNNFDLTFVIFSKKGTDKDIIKVCEF